MPRSPFPCVLFDWGGTLMAEDGPQDIAMAFWPHVKAIEGSAETLARLAPHHRLAIATNATVSGREQIEVALERVSLRQYISEIFCFTEIGVRKETPEFWLSVMGRLKVTAHDIAMIGDSLEQDVLAPSRLGIFSVWFNEDYKQGLPPDGVPTIHKLPELVPLVSHQAV